MEDFLALAAAFGEEGDWLDGDFDQDGTVGFSDFLFLSENFDQSNPWLEPWLGYFPTANLAARTNRAASVYGGGRVTYSFCCA